ncbi:MAG: dockerin type I domain-containing protein [Clostridia bacterium]|nr:dockerin type I domain-containing protein [Clostridia bacterium]
MMYRKTKNRMSFKALSLLLCVAFVFSLMSVTAVAAPGTPSIFIENDGAGGTNFTVGFNIWWGDGATSWKLFEDDKEIFGENLSSGMKASYQVKDKTYGVYKYRVEVSNSSGTSVSKDQYQVVGGASKITVKEGDIGAQAFQVTVNQGVSDFNLSHIEIPNATFSVVTNNDSVADISIVNGNILRVNAKKAGRTSAKIKENSKGDVRLVGIRVKTADGKLPGLPDYLSIGSVMLETTPEKNFWSDYQPGDKNKRMDIRYIYINGEPDAWERGADGWQKWGGSIRGDRAINYIRNSKKMGMIPFFVYYCIPGSAESYSEDKAKIESPIYLSYYFKDLKFFLDIVKREAGDDIVGMVLEPDFIGYMMQNSGGSQPVPADKLFANTKLVYETAFGGTNATGILNSKTDLDPVTGKPFADNIQGLVRCINYMIKKFCPNPYFGWQFNLWANPAPGVPGLGLMHKTDELGIAAGRDFIRARAKETADYYINAGILSSGANFISMDKYGQDATAFEPASANDPASSRWFFNADHWTNYLSYANELNKTTKLPVVLWQLPVGHIERSQEPDPYHGGLFNQLDNTKAFEDSSATYFFGDTFKPGAGNRWNFFKSNGGNDPLVTNNGTDTITWGSHFKAAKEAGVIAALFGAGVGHATHGNCNDTTSATEPDDDMWFVTKVQRYLKNPVPLDVQPTTGYKVSGYIAPDFIYSDESAPKLKSGFTVEINGTGKRAVTNSSGYFEILDVPSNPAGYTLKVSKPNYLYRNINNVVVTGDTQISSAASPKYLWAGDMVIGDSQDNAINMTDILELINHFNTAVGDGKYVEASDLNLDTAINMTDILIIVNHFNKIPADYPN